MRATDVDARAPGVMQKAIKGKTISKKKSGSKFVLDCTTAETDSILDVAAFVSSLPIGGLR
jgi:hypothetical protein